MLPGGVSGLGLDGNSRVSYRTEEWEGSILSGTCTYTSTHMHVCCDAAGAAALGSHVHEAWC